MKDSVLETTLGTFVVFAARACEGRFRSVHIQDLASIYLLHRVSVFSGMSECKPIGVMSGSSHRYDYNQL